MTERKADSGQRTAKLWNMLPELVGLILLSVGLWRLSPEWCLIIVGALITGCSMIGNLRK